MGFIFKGILAVIWLLVVPCLAGRGFYFRRGKRTCGEYLSWPVIRTLLFCRYRAAFLLP
ncbi:MAG: hypothetical protein ACLVBP_00195 [Ruminococcus sp.]